MTFGLSGAAIAGIASAGAQIISNYAGANAADDASATQVAAAKEGIAVTDERLAEIKKLLEPYLTQGSLASQEQANILGLGAPGSEAAAIGAIQGGQTFQALSRSGENAILQNASATGGLRGGNVQGALAQFQPQLLQSLVQQRFGNLGALSTLGQNSAVNFGQFASAIGRDQAALLQQQGAAKAGGELANGDLFASIPSAISSGVGVYKGLGGRF
jgi:hypothetical protein